jgi:uncharacterized BrkB/YihY/UPF0761 family membrane protein
VFLLFRIAPRRQIGPPRAILAGSLVGVVLWAAFTGLLSLYFSIQTGSAYGCCCRSSPCSSGRC